MKNWMVYASGVLFFGIILIVLIIVFARRDDTPQNGSKQPAQSQTKSSRLKDAKATGSSVTYTTRGSVVGEDRYRAIRITINASTRTVEILSGYNEQVIKSQSYANTQAAYDAFLEALEGANMTSTQASREGLDEGSACPLGLLYEFKATVPGKEDFRSWATSCSRADGTFAGDLSLTRSLFQKQIPDYDDFVRGVRLNY